MPLAHIEVVRIMRRRHLHGTGAEIPIDELVGDYRNLTLDERK